MNKWRRDTLLSSQELDRGVSVSKNIRLKSTLVAMPDDTCINLKVDKH